jgi:hypothetical protein
MKMEFDLQTRLQWLDTNHIQYGQNVTVVEPSAEGEAEVCITADNALLLVKTTEKNALGYLRQKKVADGTVCEFVSNTSVNLHLIECKRTVEGGFSRCPDVGVRSVSVASSVPSSLRRQ